MSAKKKPMVTNLKAPDKLKDSEIDYFDIPELDKEFFKRGRLVKPSHKKSLTVSYGEEVIAYFKNHVGKSYQSKLNAILKAYVKSLG